MQILLLVYLFIGFVATAKGPLFPPRKVTARVTSPYSLQIRWRDPSLRQGVKDGRRYFVRYQAQAKNRSEENEREEFIKLSKRRLKIYGLLPNTTYSVAVKVVKGKRSSAWSDIIQVTTSEERIDDSMVQNVTATALSSSSVALSWQLPKTTDGVGSYIVIAQSTNGKGRQRKSALSNETTSYVVQNLRPNQLYSFRIQSVKDIPPHSMSRQVIARPFSAKPSRPPNAFKLRLTNSSVVIISWKPPNPRSRNGPLIGYRISYKRKRSRKSDIQFVTAKKDQKVYELKDIMRNTTYKVRIAALNINGTGPFTRWKSIFVEPVKVTDNDNQKLQPSTPVRLEVSGPTPDPSPSPPSEIKLVNRTGSTLYLTWPVPPTPECCPVMAYRITVQNLNDSTDVKQLVKGSAQVHITALHPDTMYRVNVTTLNSAGESQVSEQLIVSTSGFVPPEVTYIHAEAAVLGNDANLTCKAKGQELPSLEWYLQSSQGYVNIVDIGKTNLSISKRAVVTTSTDGHDLKTSSLILYEVTRMAEMEYVCIAKNSVGFKRKTLTLIVNEPPEIIYAEGMTVLEEAKARLVCEARGKPLPEIMWIHERLRTAIAETEEPSYTEGMYVRSTHDLETLTRLSYLEIPQVHHYNYGDYACVAKSLSGQDHATVRLDIQELPPQVTKIQTIALSPSRVSVNWLRPLNYSYAIPFYQVSYRQMRRGSPVLYKNVTRVGTELYGLEHNTVYLIVWKYRVPNVYQSIVRKKRFLFWPPHASANKVTDLTPSARMRLK
ncbi:neogenin [Plakobranchus ocellatus]|uniref:Neogenin n=1 Tax=Plakobranchus ocellatus TaxID=259542 RepID=A0AAV4DAJ2_9GAST|nr:neogenin [Plakobranchus ocellatus]